MNKISLDKKQQRTLFFSLSCTSLIISHVPFVWMMLTAAAGGLFFGAKLLFWALLLGIDFSAISFGILILIKKSQNLWISILIGALMMLVVIELPTNLRFFYDGFGDLFVYFFGR
jgi:NO-binding membrane sensor protein with MHYT domain